jgi:hypothetical protein
MHGVSHRTTELYRSVVVLLKCGIIIILYNTVYHVEQSRACGMLGETGMTAEDNKLFRLHTHGLQRVKWENK